MKNTFNTVAPFPPTQAFSASQPTMGQDANNMLSHMLRLCDVSMGMAQQAEENKAKMEELLAEMRSLKLKKEFSSLDMDGLVAKLENRLSSSMSALMATQKSGTAILETREIERGLSEIIQRMDTLDGRYHQILHKLETLDASTNEKAARTGAQTSAFEQFLSQIRSELNANANQNTGMIEKLVDALDEKSKQDEKHQLTTSQTTSEIQSKLKELLQRPEKEHTAIITAVMEMVRGLNDLNHHIQDTTKQSVTTAQNIDQLPKQIKRELSKMISARDEKLGKALDNTEKQKAAHLKQIAELSDKLDSYGGDSALELASLKAMVEHLTVQSLHEHNTTRSSLQTNLELLLDDGAMEVHVAELKNLIDAVGSAVDDTPQKISREISDLLQSNTVIADALTDFSNKIGTLDPKFSNMMERFDEVAGRRGERLHEMENESLGRMLVGFQTVTKNIADEANELKSSVDFVKQSAAGLAEKIEVNLEQPAIDLTPAVEKIENLADMIDRKSLEVAETATSSIARIEELENRRLADLKGMDEAEKTSMNRVLVGFQLLLEKISEEADRFSQTVGKLDGGSSVPSGGVLSPQLIEAGIERFESASSVMAEAVASIEPTLVKAVHEAVQIENLTPSGEDSTPLLSNTLLNSISKMNLVCADLQKSLSSLKSSEVEGISADELNAIADRTIGHAGEIVDVASVLQMDIERIISSDDSN